MTGRRLRQCVAGLAVGGGCALGLAGDVRPVLHVPVLGQFVVEVAAAVRDVATQWLVGLCLASYFVAFGVLRRRFTREPSRAGDLAEKWLFLGLLWAALRYAVAYPAQPLGTGFVILLAGATMAQGVAAWLAWRGEEAGTAQRRLLAWLVLLLAVGACWHPGGGMQFEYRGGARWSGPWENPNQFGLLMGTGLVLAVGMAVAGRRDVPRANRIGKPSAGAQKAGFRVHPRFPPSALAHCLAGLNGTRHGVQSRVVATWPSK